MHLEEEIKAAELKKLTAETAKAEAEKVRIDFDYAVAKKEEEKKWWRKKRFIKDLTTTLAGFGILGFYINYAIIPAFQSENLQLKLINQKAELRNQEAEQRLKKDSIELATQRLKVDSLYEIQTFLVSEYIKLDSARRTLIQQNDQYIASLDNLQKQNPQVRKLEKTIRYIKQADSVIQQSHPNSYSSKSSSNETQTASQRNGQRIWRTQFSLLGLEGKALSGIEVRLIDKSNNSEVVIPHKQIEPNTYEIQIADDVTEFLVYAFVQGEPRSKYKGTGHPHREAGRRDGDGVTVWFMPQ